MNNNKSAKKKKNYLISIIILSVLLRLVSAFYLGNEITILPGTFDQISYHTLALRLIDGHGFSFGDQWWPITEANTPTAHWSFLYTFYLTIIFYFFGPNPIIARIIQAVVTGILLPILTFKIGKFLFSDTVGLVAAGISAVYIYFVYYAGTLMTESFYILTILASLYIAMLLAKTSSDADTSRRMQIKYAVFLGLILGISALLRQLIILFIPFLLLWIWWSGRKNNQKNIFISLFVTCVIVGALILPFTIYNFSRFDRFVLLNTNAGYAFFWGNHPIYGTHFEPILPPEMGSYQGLIPEDLHHLDEAALDQELLKVGIQFILEDPYRYFLLSLSRIPPYFMFWSSPESSLISNISRVFSFGITWPFMLAGLIYAPFSKLSKYKLRFESPMFSLYLFIFIYAVIHILTWTLIRYRLPIDAVLTIFAALIFVQIYQFVDSKISSKSRQNTTFTSSES